MKLLAILHETYEGPGMIRDWAALGNHGMTEVLARDPGSFEGQDNFDALVIMGGPMSVNDEGRFPWLRQEKEFIGKVIGDGRKILGICLGSQLLANCLGANVRRNEAPEIGWFPIRKKFFMHSWFPVFDEIERLNVFHWHGDTFDIPKDGTWLFESEGCKNQAFAVDDRCLGLQFHPEINEELLGEFIRHGKSDLKPARFVQAETGLSGNLKLYRDHARIMLFDLLDNFFTSD